MKKILVTITASLVCLGAFAQGKLNFATDSAHLVYFDPAGTAAADSTNSGKGVFASRMPAGANLVADLYAGTASSSLSLVSSTTFSAVADGRWNSVGVTFNNPAIASGATAFLRVDIRDDRDPTAGASAAAGHYSGTSGLFSAVAQSINSPIYQHAAPVSSTWTDGTFNMDYISAGFKGAIPVGVIPEPASIALCGLGAAALLIFRRRK